MWWAWLVWQVCSCTPVRQATPTMWFVHILSRDGRGLSDRCAAHLSDRPRTLCDLCPHSHVIGVACLSGVQHTCQTGHAHYVICAHTLTWWAWPVCQVCSTPVRQPTPTMWLVHKLWRDGRGLYERCLCQVTEFWQTDGLDMYVSVCHTSSCDCGVMRSCVCACVERLREWQRGVQWTCTVSISTALQQNRTSRRHWSQPQRGHFRLFTTPLSDMHSADHAVARCLSVRPSVCYMPVFCQNGSNFFPIR